jgi:hypothetical protein
VDIATARAVLGITPDTDLASAQKVFRARARLIHPDQAPDGIKPEAEKAMASLNEAWAVVRSHGQRSSKQPDSTDTARPQPRPPAAGECVACGSKPARKITLWTTTGLLILWRWRRFESSLCRRCADRMYADIQARSLTRGWWGIVAPLANLVNLGRNKLQVTAHRRAVGLPVGRASDVVTPLTGPLPCRSYVRPGPILATVAAVVIGVALANNELHRLAPQSAVQPIETTHVTGVGDCISGAYLAIACTDATAAYRFDEKAASANDCAEAGFAESFTDPRTGQVYCASKISH